MNDLISVSTRMNGIFEAGTILLGKYRVEGVLGRGGMGVVLKVTHLHLWEDLAVKVLLPEGAISQDVMARFLREAQSVVRLRGEHVARVSDVGVLPEGLPFMVMEYLRGIDLSGEIARRMTLPPSEAVDYVLQACEALAEAHAHGIVHRDIKPANLFLTTRPDGSPLIKVLDFGISKTPLNVTSMATKTEVVMGTPGYMSPEQMKASKDVDARTDIWALGTVLYECLSGHRPFEGESPMATVLMAGTEPPPPLNPQIPRGVQAAVLRCLEKDRRERFPSVAALAAALAPFARNQLEAATIVARTTHMQGGRSGGGGPALRLGPPSAATTLSGSTGVTQSRPRRRLAITGALLLLGSAALLTIAAVTVSVRLHGSGEGSQIESVTHDSRQPADERAVRSSGSAGSAEVARPASPVSVGPAGPAPTGSAGSGPPSTPAPPNSAAASDAPIDPDARPPAIAAPSAAEAEHVAKNTARKKHPEITVKGDKESAQKSRTEVKTETSSEVAESKVREAILAKNLREAERLLKEMAPDSVNYKVLRDQFDQTETAEIARAKQTAEIYLNGSYCQALEQYFSNDKSANQRVVVVFHDAIAKCREAARPNESKGGTGPTQSPAIRPELVPVSSKGLVGGERSGSSAGSAATPPQPSSMADKEEPPQPGKQDCNKVGATIAQAAQYDKAGKPQWALMLMRDVFKCRNAKSVMRYILTGKYACHANDVAAVKQYLKQVPEDRQADIERECQAVGVNIITRKE